MAGTPSLDQFLSHTPHLIGAASTDGRFVRLSSAWEAFLGQPLSALEGAEFIQFVHPDDREKTLSALEHVSRSNPVIGFANRYMSADGTYRQLVWRSDRAEDGLIYFTAEDVTDSESMRTTLEASNERLRQVAEIAGIGGWMVDLTTDTLSWDATTRRIHEVPEGYEPNLENAVAFYEGQAAETIGAAVANAVENHEPWDLVLPLITYTKKRIFVRASGRPLIENGVVTRLTGTFQDVTEEREYAERLEISRAAAENANEAKSRFLANMSHEIRTPLNGVLGMAQLLQRTPLNEKQAFYLKTLSESGGALVSLINDVLDLSRIEAGELTLINEAFNLEEMISNARSAVAAQAAQKGLLVNVLLGDGLPSSVVGDGARIKQVLINLLGNAVKFTDSGQITLAVEATASNHLRFAVMDTGPGIPDDKKDIIFERFTQIDESTTRRQGGTGLGLAICKDLVALASGRIRVEDTPGGGATFWFEWPLPADQAMSAQPHYAPPSQAGLRVLIAEDNAVNAMMLQEALGASGYTVVHAQNGREAVQLARQAEPDVMILDVHMPELNGFEALKQMEAATEAMPPVFLLTADVTPQTRAAAEGLNIEAFLSKPVNIDALLDAVDAVARPNAA